MLCYQHGLYEDTERCPSCEQERKAKRDNHIDFRAHTCGECAWAYVWAGKQENFTCRRTGWMNSETGDGHSVSMSACPAFVPSKVENHNVKL